MVFLVYLVLAFSVCNFCFGMEKQEEKWEIHNIHQSVFDPDSYQYEAPLGKLQIYWANDNADQYQSAARFIQNDGVIIKFSNFDNLDKKNKSIFFENKLKQNIQKVFIPVDINCGKKERHVAVTEIEYLNETEEILDIPKLKLWTNGDNIELKIFQKKYMIVHPENVHVIRQALSLNKQFIVKFLNDPLDISSMVQCLADNDGYVGKVIDYKNGSYIWWDGWYPFIKSTSNKLICTGTPMTLAISNKPDKVTIDLGKEREELHHYQRNKLISRGFVALILAGAAYGFGNIVL